MSSGYLNKGSTTNGYLKIPAAAKYADVGERTLRAWLSMGLKHSLMPAVSGKKTKYRYALIKVADLEQFIDSFKTEIGAVAPGKHSEPIDPALDPDKILANVFSPS